MPSKRDDTAKLSEARGEREQLEHVRLVNLTPHRVALEVPTEDGGVERLVLPPADAVPRLVITAGQSDVVLVRGGEEDHDEIVVPMVNQTRAIGIEPPLPEPQPGVLYITSRALAEHVPERRDLVWPEDQVRDCNGTVIGARKLGRVGNKAPAS